MNNISSSPSWGTTVLRVIVGVVFLVHGSQKLFSFGFSGVTAFFTHAGIPLPAVSAPLVTLVEFLGGLALILGVGTRVAALLLACDMVGAIVFVHFKNGFFMPTGYEFALTMLAANLSLALTGPGAASVGGMIAKKV
ncbi:MAG TPA: DoxX family protein [Terriglobales bacterium]|jgi:putative oxidoreductase|nr:DoxX family protein [Terriglobales bacterium]